MNEGTIEPERTERRAEEKADQGQQLTSEEEQAYLSALKQDVDQLKATLSVSTNSISIRAIMDQLKSIQNKVPPTVPGAGAVQGDIASALHEAERHYQEELAEEEAALDGMMTQVESAAFCYSMRKHMSPMEKKFFDSFVSGQQYQMGQWSEEEGRYVQSDQTVDGALLKEDFARIKYHTLSDEEKAQAGKPPGSKSAEKEMDRLHESLDRMEGHEANEMIKRGAGKDECRRCHERFKKAHDQTDKVKGLHRKVRELDEDGKDSKTARLALKDAEKQLGKTLQEDIIDDTLVKSPSEGRSQQYAQGVDVAQPTAQPTLPDMPGGTGRSL